MSKWMYFTRNWNNKLHNEYFTSIRLKTVQNRDYYDAGSEFLISLDSHGPIFHAEIVKTQVLKLGQIGSLTYLDAGMSPVDFIEMMKRMYSKKIKEDEHILDQDFHIILFKRLYREVKN
jgi:hypothetical protein